MNVEDFDECYCGDYRHQHENGTGWCQICKWNPAAPGLKCNRFELADRAHSIPKWYQEPIVEEG